MCKRFPGVPGQRDVLNLTAIYSARQETSLQDLAGYWSYNESFDISKYEDFDHSKFLGKDLYYLVFQLIASKCCLSVIYLFIY